MSTNNPKGIDNFTDKFVSSLEKKKATPRITSPNKKVKTIRVCSLSDLPAIGFTSMGTGVAKDAKHHLWQVDKTADGYSLVRNAEEDSDDSEDHSVVAGKKQAKEMYVVYNNGEKHSAWEDLKGAKNQCRVLIDYGFKDPEIEVEGVNEGVEDGHYYASKTAAEDSCENCGHPESYHEHEEGCEFPLEDVLEPCGCMDFEKVSEEEKKLDHQEEEAHRRRKESADTKVEDSGVKTRKCKECGASKPYAQFDGKGTVCYDCADEAGENASKKAFDEDEDSDDSRSYGGNYKEWEAATSGEVVEYDKKQWRFLDEISWEELTPGMVFGATYKDTNAGFTVDKFLGYTGSEEKYGEGGVKYQNSAELLEGEGVDSLDALEAKQGENEYGFHSYMVIEDEGKEGPYYYPFEGNWARGSGAEPLTFWTVEEVVDLEKEGNKESHCGLPDCPDEKHAHDEDDDSRWTPMFDEKPLEPGRCPKCHAVMYKHENYKDSGKTLMSCGGCGHKYYIEENVNKESYKTAAEGDLIQCRHCQEIFPKSEQECPSCGTPTPLKMKGKTATDEEEMDLSEFDEDDENALTPQFGGVPAKEDESLSDQVKRLAEEAQEYYSIQTKISPDRDDILSYIIDAIEEDSGLDVDDDMALSIERILSGSDEDETADDEDQDDWDRSGKIALVNPALERSPEDKEEIETTWGEQALQPLTEKENEEFYEYAEDRMVMDLPSDEAKVEKDETKAEEKLPKSTKAGKSYSIKEVVESNTEMGYGSALIENSTGKIIDPYVDPNDWPDLMFTQSNGGDSEDGDYSIQIHSGVLEEEYNLQKKSSKKKSYVTMTAGEYQEALPKMKDLWDNVFEEGDRWDFLDMIGGSELDVNKAFDELPLQIQDALTASYFDVHQDLEPEDKPSLEEFEPGYGEIYTEDLGYQASTKQADSEGMAQGVMDELASIEATGDKDLIEEAFSFLNEHAPDVTTNEGLYEELCLMDPEDVDMIHEQLVIMQHKEGSAEGLERDMYNRDYAPGEIKESCYEKRGGPTVADIAETYINGNISDAKKWVGNSIKRCNALRRALAEMGEQNLDSFDRIMEG